MHQYSRTLDFNPLSPRYWDDLPCQPWKEKWEILHDDYVAVKRCGPPCWEQVNVLDLGGSSYPPNCYLTLKTLRWWDDAVRILALYEWLPATAIFSSPVSTEMYTDNYLETVKIAFEHYEGLGPDGVYVEVGSEVVS